MLEKANEMKFCNGNTYDVCHGCGRIIKTSGLFGSLHICTTDDEKRKYAEEIKRRVRISEQALYRNEK